MTNDASYRKCRTLLFVEYVCLVAPEVVSWSNNHTRYKDGSCFELMILILADNDFNQPRYRAKRSLTSRIYPARHIHRLLKVYDV